MGEELVGRHPEALVVLPAHDEGRDANRLVFVLGVLGHGRRGHGDEATEAVGPGEEEVHRVLAGHGRGDDDRPGVGNDVGDDHVQEGGGVAAEVVLGVAVF